MINRESTIAVPIAKTPIQAEADWPELSAEEPHAEAVEVPDSAEPEFAEKSLDPAPNTESWGYQFDPHPALLPVLAFAVASAIGAGYFVRSVENQIQANKTLQMDTIRMAARAPVRDVHEPKRIPFVQEEPQPALDLQARAVAPVIELRDGPGPDFKVLTTAKAGTLLSVLDWKGRWFEVSMAGKVAWVDYDSIELLSSPGRQLSSSPPKEKRDGKR